MINERPILNQNNNQNNKLEIIWIDQNITNNENQGYIKELKSNNIHNIHQYTDMNKAIELIKNIRFIETIIIVSGSYLPELIKQFKKNLKQIYIIPKIIVFTSPHRILDDEVLKEKFYSGVILKSF